MRYAAFISYASTDRVHGEALQKALEAFVLPAPLRGQNFGHGPLNKRLGAVFRDRWDADASVDLGAELRQALAASAALVVMCSATAARSHWVGEEIREFKRLGRGERIFAVLLDGLPCAHEAVLAPHGAFHPALFERWNPLQQRFEAEAREPLAPDLREGGDGLRFTVLKLVAALTGVPLTTLTQRQAEAERRERNLARGVAVAMAVLAIGATAGGWASWQSAALARVRLENAVEMAARRVDDAAAFQDRYGVPSAVIQQLLDGARLDFDELTADAAHAPMLALQQARLDRLLAGHYEAAGEGGLHQQLAERALQRLARVPTERRLAQPRTWLARLPDEAAVVVERLQALSAQAQAAATRGEVALARQLLDRMAGEADARLAQHTGRQDGRPDHTGDPGEGPSNVASKAPSNVPSRSPDHDLTGWRSLAAQARAQRARLAYEAGQLAPALAELQAALRILGPAPAARTAAAAPLAASGPELVVELADVAAVADVALAAERLALQSEQAEMLLEMGQHAQALAVQQAVVIQLQQLNQAHQAGPASPEARRQLATALARRGDMQLASTRQLALARADYQAAHDLLAGLSAADPARTDYKRDLSLAHERLGDADLQANQLASARQAYASCLALRRELVMRNPAQVEWRRDLSVALERLGDIEAQQGHTAPAQTAYAEALALRQAAHQAAPADAVATRDLAVLWMRIGRARATTGAATGAAKATADGTAAMHQAYAQAYAQAITLMQPLAEQSAPDSRWRRDLAVAHAERGEALRLAGYRAGAVADLQRALELVRALRLHAPDDAQLAQDEAWLRQRLAR